MIPAVAHTADFQRVLSLPRRVWSEEDLEKLALDLTSILKTPAGTMRLKHIQALALHDAGVYGGLFGPIAVGGGKTLLTLLLPAVLESRRPLLLLPGGLIEKTQRERIELSKQWRIPSSLRVFSYDMLGRVEAESELATYKPDLIIADECFTGTTLVRTENGPRRISDIVPGQYVWSLGIGGPELREVLGVGETLTNELYRIHFEGKHYDCTAGHPWLTRQGWKCSAELSVGDEVVRDMRPEFQVKAVPETKVLLEEMRIHESEASGGLVRENVAVESWPISEDQWNDTTGSPRESIRNSSQEWYPSEDPRGQWPRNDDPASVFTLGFRAWLEGRKEISLGQVRDPGMASGYLSRESENCGRGGREQSQYSGSKSARREEKAIFRGVGLDRVEGIERHGIREVGRSCRVYNLHVEGTNNFILEHGHVVHNCHKLKNKRAAVTRRVARYMHDQPLTHFCGVSGTIMSRSLKDFAHILLWCLKTSAPVPTALEEIEEWAEALDEGVDPLARRKPGALLEFCTEEEKKARHPARVGFCRRLTETPGVVATVGEGEHVDCSIYVRASRHKVSAETERHFETLRSAWETPDGWQLSQAVDVWRHAQELALGLFYAWEPRPPTPWLESRRDWNRFVRETISRGRTYDSELHVANACDAGKLPTEALAKWRSIRDTFTPNVIPVWCDDSALHACADWMKSPGLVWVEHRFFAQRLSELTGVPYYEGGGFDATGKYVEDAPSNTSAIVSCDANREGKNLQKLWHRNLLVCPPASAAHWEQLIARTHRPGQTADEVIVDILLGCRENFDACQKALEGARAIQEVTGKSQKLLLADIVLPSESEVDRIGTPRWRK